MKKMTAAQVTALLKAAGVADVEIVADEKDASPEAVKVDELLAEIDKARTPIIKPQILQEVKDEVNQATTGTVSGTYKSAIARAFKAAGITRSELDKFDKPDDLLNFVLEKHNATYSKDTEQLRDELKTMAQKHSEAIDKLKGDHTKALQASEEKFIDREIDEVLAGIVKEIPRTGGNELTQARQVKAYLRENFNLHYDQAKKALELRDKNNPELPAFNDTKTAALQAKDLTKTFLADLGVVAKDMRNTDPKKVMDESGNGNNGNNSGGGSRTDNAAPVNEVQSHIDTLLAGPAQ